MLEALTVQRHICQSMSGLSLPISVFPFLDGMHHRCNLGFFSSSHFNAVHSCLTQCFVWPKFKITGSAGNQNLHQNKCASSDSNTWQVQRSAPVPIPKRKAGSRICSHIDFPSMQNL